MNGQEVIQTAIADIRPVDELAREEARMLQSRLTKPAGSLGRLEELHVWMAGVRGSAVPSIEHVAIVVAAADHGVVAEGVSAYPQEVTGQMVRNMLSAGAAVCVLAAHAGADVHLVDAGVCGDFDDPRLRSVKAHASSANIANGPAMSHEDAEQLVASGIACAQELWDSGVDAIGLGDMGIGNTTPAAALTSVIAGLPPSNARSRSTRPMPQMASACCRRSAAPRSRFSPV